MKTRIHSPQIGWWLAAMVLAVSALGGGYFIFARDDSSYRTLPLLSASEYLENSNSLRGNSYKFSGAILNSLAWSPTAGRLFSVEVKGGDSDSSVLPVLVPAKFNSVNVQRGQRYHFQVQVDERGILLISNLQKE
jgi:hypothetical protein